MDINNLNDREFALLLAELNNLHSRIDHFDQRSFQIKGWSITLFSGSIALWANGDKTVFLLLGILSVLMFWYLDALFKSFQYRFIERNKQLESFISHGSNDFTPGLVAGNFGRGGTFFQKLRKIVGFAFFDNIFTIYATKVTVLAVIFLFDNIA